MSEWTVVGTDRVTLQSDDEGVIISIFNPAKDEVRYLKRIAATMNAMAKVKQIRERLKQCDVKSLEWPDPILELHSELWATIDELAKAEG